jgi:hypothetical protein
MDIDTSPPDEINTPESVGDVRISEIVEQELATAVSAPDAVYVLSVWYRDDDYTSVHTTQQGAEARLQKTAGQWGITDVLNADQLTHRIEKLPVETP